MTSTSYLPLSHLDGPSLSESYLLFRTGAQPRVCLVFPNVPGNHLFLPNSVSILATPPGIFLYQMVRMVTCAALWAIPQTQSKQVTLLPRTFPTAHEKQTSHTVDKTPLLPAKA